MEPLDTENYKVSFVVVTNIVNPDKYSESYIGSVECSPNSKNSTILKIKELLIKSGKTKNLSTYAVDYIAHYIYGKYISSSINGVDRLELFDVVIKRAIEHMKDEIVEYMLES